jgi:hypothetical protein
MARRIAAIASVFVSILICCNVSHARFVEPDPIGQEGGVNVFEYCLENPVNNIDPYGQDAGVISGPLIIIGGAAIVSGYLASPPGQQAAKDAATAISQGISRAAGRSSNPCGPDGECERLIQQINQHMNMMETKNYNLAVDQYGLYDLGIPHPIYGAWATHVTNYDGYRIGLLRMVATAMAKGCAVPPRVFEMLFREAPNKPFYR